MERLKERLRTAEKTLNKLHEITIKSEINEIERDALIQRFEFAFEIMWKCGKDYLRVIEGIEVASPKGVIRHFREIGIFDNMQTEQALQIADDRNLTTHTYDEAFALEIVKRIIEHEGLLWDWNRKMMKICE